MGQRAPEGAPVTHLGIANLGRGCCQQAGLCSYEVAGLYVPVARQRPDGQYVAVLPNVRQVG